MLIAILLWGSVILLWGSGEVLGPVWPGKSHSHQRCDSSDSSSSLLRPSPPSKRLRADRRSPVCRSSSQDDRWQSPGSCHHRASPSHASRRSHSPTSHSKCRRSRDRSALSHHPSLASMTRRLARNASLSRRRRSPLHQVWRSPGAVLCPLARGGCPLIAAAIPFI